MAVSCCFSISHPLQPHQGPWKWLQQQQPSVAGRWWGDSHTQQWAVKPSPPHQQLQHTSTSTHPGHSELAYIHYHDDLSITYSTAPYDGVSSVSRCWLHKLQGQDKRGLQASWPDYLSACHRTTDKALPAEHRQGTHTPSTHNTHDANTHTTTGMLTMHTMATLERYIMSNSKFIKTDVNIQMWYFTHHCEKTKIVIFALCVCDSLVGPAGGCPWQVKEAVPRVRLRFGCPVASSSCRSGHSQPLGTSPDQ